MRVYISGAITGKEDYLGDFTRGQTYLEGRGCSTVNPAMFELIANCLTYEEYMKIGLALLDMCDAIYMMQGWQESKGCNREYGYAMGAGKKIMFEE